MNEKTLFNGVKIPRALSYSRINKFLNCRLQYYYDYIEGKETPNADPLDIGKAIHQCLEHYAKHCLESGLEQDPEFMQELAFDIDYLDPDAWNDMNEVVMNFAEHHRYEEEPDYYEVEKSVALDTDLEECGWQDDDVAFRLKIDFVEKTSDDTIIITDWKSNRNLLADYEVQDDLQLLVYAWAASKVWPDMEHFKIQLHFVRYNAFRPRQDNVYERARADKIEQRLFKIFDQMYEAEKNNDFEATINSNCKFCPFRKLCDRFQEVNDNLDGAIEVPETDEERRELAEEYMGVKSRQSQLRDSLKEEVEKSGPIEVGEETLDFHPTSSTSFDSPRKIISYLRENTDIPKDELWRCLSISKSDIKDLLDEYGEYDKLSEISESTSGTRFSFKKEGR